MAVRVTVWNEFRHETHDEAIKKIYPEGIHGCIAAFLRENGFDAKTATLDMPEHGLTDEVLAATDVLVWWGHLAHGEVREEIVDRVQRRVLDGMGLIALHSAHASKIMRRLCGTDSDLLKWREMGEKEILWVINPSHPIAQGCAEKLIIEHEEMYGEPFCIPKPDDIVFMSWFEGGEIFRSGVTFTRGKGKIFYFRPGHEAFPIYHMPEIQRILVNAVRWAAPLPDMPVQTTGHAPTPVVPVGR